MSLKMRVHDMTQKWWAKGRTKKQTTRKDCPCIFVDEKKLSTLQVCTI